jgi:hypothetical protein
MAASTQEKALFRLEFGGDATTLTDAYIDGLYDLAEDIYGTEDRAKVTAAAYLYHATSLLAQAETSVDYTANTASEKLSQIYERLKLRVAKYQAALDFLVNPPAPVAQWASLRKVPPPVRRYPTTGGIWDDV